MNFSFVIPVYNRPEELTDLLISLKNQTDGDFEVVIIEDGSKEKSDKIVEKFSEHLNVRYYFKANTGPGDSRNYGMKAASSDYFIILDSDCILPRNYMKEVRKSLVADFVDCFGGADTASDDFSDTQKAINFTMTSFLTTGGIRGGSEKTGKFQPRSFNMGISKKAFEATGGFGHIHPGEDPDLVFRLWEKGFETRLLKNVYVFHKRRLDWDKFRVQVNKFGKVRPILSQRYPQYAKLTYWFPTLFILGFFALPFLLFFNIFWPALLYLFYFFLIFLLASFGNNSTLIGLKAMKSTLIQFKGYGLGFLESWWKIKIFKKKPEKAFPELFYIKDQMKSNP